MDLFFKFSCEKVKKAHFPTIAFKGLLHWIYTWTILIWFGKVMRDLSEISPAASSRSEVNSVSEVFFVQGIALQTLQNEWNSSWTCHKKTVMFLLNVNVKFKCKSHLGFSFTDRQLNKIKWKISPGLQSTGADEKKLFFSLSSWLSDHLLLTEDYLWSMM